MRSRRIGFGLGVALPMVSVCLTLNAPALAQPADPPQDPAPIEGGELTPAEPAEPPAPEPEPVPVPEPAPEPEPAPAPPMEAAPPPAPASEVVAAPESAAPSREQSVKLLGLEQLPGSAFPEKYTRGLKHGSLSLTFHGQQWPYMPMLDEPGVRIGFSGYLWNDLSNTRISVDESLRGAGLNDQNRYTTQTRGVLRFTPTYNAGDGWFAQGNGEIVVQGDMRPEPGTGVATTSDDVYVRVGKWDVFDITVGRFQAWEISNHFGMALDYATLERQGAWIVTSSLPRPADGYGLTYFWDRQNFLLGTYALHVYPTDYLRGELLGHVGAGNSANASNPHQMDIRPSAIFDVGWLKLKAGWEYGKAIPQDKEQKVRDSKNGWGLAAQGVFLPYVEGGISFARGYQDILDQNGNPDLTASNTVESVGGFLNISPNFEPLLFGFGAFWNSYENLRIDTADGEHFGEVDTNKQRLMFAAVQYTVWDRMMFKFVLSHATNEVRDFRAGIYTNDALSGRLRMMVTY